MTAPHRHPAGTRTTDPAHQMHWVAHWTTIALCGYDVRHMRRYPHGTGAPRKRPVCDLCRVLYESLPPARP